MQVLVQSSVLLQSFATAALGALTLVDVTRSNMVFETKKRDFTIKKGTPLVGSLKPEKVSRRKVTETIPGAPMPGSEGGFGNMGTTQAKKSRIKMDY